MTEKSAQKRSFTGRPQIERIIAGMGQMPPNEAREQLAEEYERIRNAAIAAEVYGVSEWQVYRLAKQKQETGSVALCTSQRGRNPKMSEKDLQRRSG